MVVSIALAQQPPAFTPRSSRSSQKFGLLHAAFVSVDSKFTLKVSAVAGACSCNHAAASAGRPTMRLSSSHSPDRSGRHMQTSPPSVLAASQLPNRFHSTCHTAAECCSRASCSICGAGCSRGTWVNGRAAGSSSAHECARRVWDAEAAAGNQPARSPAHKPKSPGTPAGCLLRR